MAFEMRRLEFSFRKKKKNRHEKRVTTHSSGTVFHLRCAKKKRREGKTNARSGGVMKDVPFEADVGAGPVVRGGGHVHLCVHRGDR